ncbi:MAG: rhomboid family intramembrane serine protease [Acidimicrobiia bacterium]
MTYSLIAVSVLLFLVSFLARDAWIDLAIRFAADTREIRAGEIWRGLTVVFFHDTSPMHILFNMYALYLFGPRLEREVGSPAFAGIYFASAAGGSVFAVAFGPANGFSVGASGAIFGLFGAWLFVSYKLRSTPAGRAMFNQLGVLLLINLALPLFIPRIDWRAHVGGLLAGALVAWLWSITAAGKPNARAIRTGIAFAALAVLMVFLALL